MILLNFTEQILINSLCETSVMDRWNAARSGGGDNWLTEPWFIWSACICLGALIVLLLAINMGRFIKTKKIGESLFIRHAKKSGLTDAEVVVLLQVAKTAGMKHVSDIFTNEEAYSESADKLYQIVKRRDGESKASDLKTIFAVIYDKLRFQHVQIEIIEDMMDDASGGTRKIPRGTKIYISRRKNEAKLGIETSVIDNTQEGLRLNIIGKVKIELAEVWYARYIYGSSIWGFETSVIGFKDGILQLNHNDNITLSGRRRFRDLCIDTKVLYAKFDSFADSEKNNEGQDISIQGPVFIESEIKELGGTWIKFLTDQKLATDQRVLVIFKLGETVIRDIGYVRRNQKYDESNLAVVELIGLTDTEIEKILKVSANILKGTNNTEQEGQRREIAAVSERGDE